MRQYKEPVRIREKKLKDGGGSLYLDIYENGRRTYEFLRLYTLPPNAPNAAVENARVMKIAVQVKAQRIIAMQSSRHGVMANVKIPLLAYAERKEEDFCRRAERARGIKHVPPRPFLAKLREYASDRDTLQNATADWARGFVDFLYNSGLKPISVSTYLACAKSVFLQAIKEGLITASPFATIPQPRKEQKQRNYLTVEELRAFSAAPYDEPQKRIRRAFIFSCLTGLRASDVIALKWTDIEHTAGRARIIFRQKKTRAVEYLDISEQAAAVITEIPQSGDTVFSYGSVFSIAQDMKRHAAPLFARAGIRKHITFHCARHTFATMLLSSGVDLFTTSKLLGHTDIKTTQIYARIIDEKKRAAVDALPAIL